MKLWKALFILFLLLTPFIILAVASQGESVTMAVQNGTFQMPTAVEVFWIALIMLIAVFTIAPLFYLLIWLAINSVRPQWWRDL